LKALDGTGKEKKMDSLVRAQNLFGYTQGLRRDFHRFPELGFRETRTAGVIARELAGLGVEFQGGIAETGVVAIIKGKRHGPVVLLRFDMDALPIQEQTEVEYISQNAGVMHACGHDGHTAIGLSVARLLHTSRSEWNGMVKLVFQPAEEGLGGAKRMIEAGVLENPVPDVALGLHVWNERPIGWLGITPGAMMSAAEIFNIRLTGKGGHGAAPHLAVDPLPAATQIVTALQSIVSRNVAPLQTAVVSVTSIHGGEAFNVIPSQVELQGTIRSFEPEVRQRVLSRFSQIVHQISAAFECEASIDLKSISPAVVNDAMVSQRVLEVARVLLPEHELSTVERTMGSEDMSYFLQQVPGCFIFIGSANAALGLSAAHHHPRFDFDEQVLPEAVALLEACTLSLLSQEV
jgi:amidohydrolase